MADQPRILVVDDEPGLLRVVERVLGRRNQVRSVGTPAEALALMRAYAPDLAILDIRMPEMDGFELMQRLKEIQPDLDVILMTGSLSDPDEKLVRAIRQNAFYFVQKPFDREVLETLVDRCLELRRLAQENRQHVSRLEHELGDARRFQESLLPKPAAELNGVSLECRYRPSSELGGDLYDYATAGTTRTAFLIADSSGHGVSAAMLTGIVKSVFHAAAADRYDPLAVVERAREALRAFPAERFVTLFVAVITRRPEGFARLDYVNAGHPPGLVWSAGNPVAPRLLTPTGPILSPVFPAGMWERGRATLAPGDQLLLYTDGVSEAPAGELSAQERLIEGDFFGDERVSRLVTEHPAGGTELLDAILAAVDAHAAGRPLPDDLTLVCARVVGSPVVEIVREQ